MPDFQIRPATDSDVPVILSLIRALAEYEKEPPESVKTDEVSLRRSLFGANPAAEVLLASDSERPVGFALFFHNFSTWTGKPGIYLEDLFVQPEMRGQGIGNALLRELARIAKQRGCGRLEWAVLDWNTPAIDFYKRMGAVPMHEWTVFRLDPVAIERLAGDAPPEQPSSARPL